MTPLRRTLIAIGVLGVVMGITVVALTTDLGDALDFVLGLVGGWAFIAAGIFAWSRRPENRLGLLMVLAGFAILGTQLTAAHSGIHVVGEFLNPLAIILLIHILLAFPTGRLESTFARWLVGIAYFDGVLLQVLFVLSWDPAYTDEPHPNPLLVIDSRTFFDVISAVQSVIGVLGLGAVAIALIRRYTSSAPLTRRVLKPVYAAGIGTLALLSISLFADVSSVPDGTLEDIVDVLAKCALAAVPFAFVGGLLGVRLAQGGGISDLVRSVGSGGDLRALLADALGDPTLELAYWLPEGERYVDAGGADLELPAQGSGRSATLVDHDGRHIAAIVHDSALDEDRDLVEGAGAAVALALENERLAAELRARVEELRSSRTRIVEAGLAERRRLERDLHDGAQQRLVALRLALRLARDRTAKDPEGAADLLGSASSELDEALAELRELARGIHPAVLTDRGLEPALTALATRAPLPVEVTADAGDLPPAIESATYFVVAEALTNVAKYAEATSARVRVERRNGAAVVEIRDDGIGGADPSSGSGLSGLADRVAALDGTLSVESPVGQGTVVRVTIPVADRQ